MILDTASIRAQFPILSEKVYGHDLVYLDNAATTQNPSCVIDETVRMQAETNGNIHRGIHFMAERSTEIYENARNRVRDFIGASSSREVIFTSGATASLNLAAYCFCEKYLGEGDNVVITVMEHHSNLVPWQVQAARKGAQLRAVLVTEEGALDLDALDSLIDDRTRIVAVTAASNVLGTFNDIPYITAYCHKRGIPVLVDGSQSVQHGRVDVSDVDFFAFSGHKIFSPTGIGVLYGKEKWLEEMPPFMCGGDMISSVSLDRGTSWADLPLKFEAGTSNYMGAAALDKAIEWYSSFDSAQVERHLTALTMKFERLLADTVQGVRIYGTVQGKAPIVSFRVDGCHPMDIAQIADRQGVALRSGTQCAQPLLERFGTDSVCRASMALYNTEEEIEMAVSAVARAVKMLRR